MRPSETRFTKKYFNTWGKDKTFYLKSWLDIKVYKTTPILLPTTRNKTGKKYLKITDHTAVCVPLPFAGWTVTLSKGVEHAWITVINKYDFH